MNRMAEEKLEDQRLRTKELLERGPVEHDCHAGPEDGCDCVICEYCGGLGQVEILEHVTGDNIIPGGFYEGSGEYETCVCQKE